MGREKISTNACASLCVPSLSPSFLLHSLSFSFSPLIFTFTRTGRPQHTRSPTPATYGERTRSFFFLHFLASLSHVIRVVSVFAVCVDDYQAALSCRKRRSNTSTSEIAADIFRLVSLRLDSVKLTSNRFDLEIPSTVNSASCWLFKRNLMDVVEPSIATD